MVWDVNSMLWSDASVRVEVCTSCAYTCDFTTTRVCDYCTMVRNFIGIHTITRTSWGDCYVTISSWFSVLMTMKSLATTHLPEFTSLSVLSSVCVVLTAAHIATAYPMCPIELFRLKRKSLHIRDFIFCHIYVLRMCVKRELLVFSKLFSYAETWVIIMIRSSFWYDFWGLWNAEQILVTWLWVLIDWRELAKMFSDD